MTSGLIPERPLLVSPTLAATIGLEEALMLQTLAERIEQQPPARSRPQRPELRWSEFSPDSLQDLFPFWQPVDIRRIQRSLQALGLLLMDACDESEHVYLAIEQTNTGAPSDHIVPPSRPPTSRDTGNRSGTADLIPPHWQPDDNWVRMCKQHAIPEQFIRDLVPEFVSYWRERGQARFSWGNAFYKHVLKEWRNEQTRRGSFEMASTMSETWKPSADAVEILLNAGISGDFIEDAIPEFVLYWRERGVVQAAWNTRFIEHIRRQWARFRASFGRDDTPRPIPADWMPSRECYEILQLAEIDADYARSRIPEFVLYWRDSGQARASWNTTFLQFIKQDWARRLQQATTEINHAEDQALAGSSQQRIQEKFRQIADRSWAD